MKRFHLLILAGLLVLFAAPAAADAGDLTGNAFGAGTLVAQAQPQGGMPGGQGGMQGGQGGDPCMPSYQRCVMMCAGVGNCVENCNMGYAACQQQRQGKPKK